MGTKARALKRYIGADVRYQDSVYHVDGREYLVMTDRQADKAVREYVRDTLWAFRPAFLARFTQGVPERAIKHLQDLLYEDANDTILAMVGRNIGRLVQEAIGADGRGNFLATYDSVEEELGDDLYAYRIG